MDDQHIYHHAEKAPPTINVKAERNSKGWNYEATVIGAETVDAALTLLADATRKLEAQYGKVAQ